MKQPDLHKKYDANFTAGGLLYQEFLSIKDLLLTDNFSELINQEKEQNNFIGIPTQSARKRIISEILRRNNNAPVNFWETFFTWNESEQKLALLFLCLKSYPLIMDLQLEVALKKYKTGSSLDVYDVQMRMDEIASTDETVNNWSSSTYKKINVQYRKALRDAGLYDGKFLKKPDNISESFKDYFRNNGESWFLNLCFLNS